jgi:hypothetical protein
MSEDQKILVRRVQVVLKFVQLGLAVICVGLIVDPINHKMQSNAHYIILVSAAYGGFIFINTIVILGHLRAQRMPQFMVRSWSEYRTGYRLCHGTNDSFLLRSKTGCI